MAIQARDIEVADGAHVVQFHEHDTEPEKAAAPGIARRRVVEALRQWGAASTLVNDVALVISELATNAVRHADSPFTVTVRASGSTLRIAVHDAVPLAGRLSEAWLAPQPLHGLSLVDALCTSWGVEDTRHGKVVWAELPCAAALVAEA
jgi:hypothetical protein